MTQPQALTQQLEAVLTPQAAFWITARAEAAELAALVDEDEEGWEAICGYISQRGRVIAVSRPGKDPVIYEGEIHLNADGSWDPAPPHRLWQCTVADQDAVVRTRGGSSSPRVSVSGRCTGSPAGWTAAGEA